MVEFLRNLGCYKRGDLFILDGFSPEFYLIFDTSYDPETPESLNTCDILVQSIGVHPKESKSKYCLVSNANTYDIVKFLRALGLDRFPKKTYNFIRTFN